MDEEIESNLSYL